MSGAPILFMKIEIVSIPDCPNHIPTLERVKSVMNSQSWHFPVTERIVTSEEEATDFRFGGSPTVLVNGCDLEPSTRIAARLTCRIYSSGSGIPSRELIRTAIERALQSSPADPKTI